MPEPYVILLKKINDRMYQHANNELAAAGLTLTQMRLLVYIAQQEIKVVSLKQAEKEFEVAQATMAGIVARLEKNGFIEAHTEPADKRVKMIQLTAKAETFLKEHRDSAETRDRRIVAGLTEEEIQNFNRYLQIVYCNLVNDENGKE